MQSGIDGLIHPLVNVCLGAVDFGDAVINGEPGGEAFGIGPKRANDPIEIPLVTVDSLHDAGRTIGDNPACEARHLLLNP